MIFLPNVLKITVFGNQAFNSIFFLMYLQQLYLATQPLIPFIFFFLPYVLPTTLLGYPAFNSIFSWCTVVIEDNRTTGNPAFNPLFFLPEVHKTTVFGNPVFNSVYIFLSTGAKRCFNTRMTRWAASEVTTSYTTMISPTWPALTKNVSHNSLVIRWFGYKTITLASANFQGSKKVTVVLYY